MRLIDVGSVVQRKPTHGCTGGVTAGIMPVWYAAIDTPGSGTNCGVGGATTGAATGCTGCVGVAGGVGTGCVCVANRLTSDCRLSCCLLSVSCCDGDGALSA